VIGTNYKTSQQAIEIAEADKNLFAAIGFHPSEYIEPAIIAFKNARDVSRAVNDTTEDMSLDMDDLTTLSSDKIIAIGETGLDYFRLDAYNKEQNHVIKHTQHEALRKHIQLARSRQLPLILHVRDQAEDAYWDVLNLLDQEEYDGQFILHCVSGPLAYIKQAIEMGAYISIAGNVTYSSAHRIREIARLTPPDRILLETDAPFLPPVPHRGKPCDPWMIELTAQYLEEELSIDLEQCYENTLQLFPQLSTTL
jgi:TatD DNase family protein